MEPIVLTLPILGARAPRGSQIGQRILYRLVFDGCTLDPDECWPWPGAVNDAGYGRIGADPGGDSYVHRVSFREFVGPIPDDFEVDHVCHNKSDCRLGDACPHRRCCNPHHLRVVEFATNIASRKHRGSWARPDGSCSEGEHLWAPRNGYSGCRTCYNARMKVYLKEYRARGRAA